MAFALDYGLVQSVANRYCIIRGDTETEGSYLWRVYYSLLTQTGLSALCDVQEDNLPVSIRHFKQRIEETAQAFSSIHMKDMIGFSFDLSELIDEIYNVYIDSGCIYHEPNRLTFAPFRASSGSKCILLRGLSLNDDYRVSGAGSYRSKDDATDVTLSILDMFRIEKEYISEFWSRLVRNQKYIRLDAKDIPFEYLKNNSRNGEWTNSPDTSGDISLMRTGQLGKKLYYLYRYDGSELYLSQLPEWFSDDRNRRKLQVSCLAYKSLLPPCRFHVDGSVVHLSLDYLYPKEEMSLLKLYSWPEYYIRAVQNYHRTMSLDVFTDIKSAFESIGYAFKEE